MRILNAVFFFFSKNEVRFRQIDMHVGRRSPGIRSSGIRSSLISRISTSTQVHTVYTCTQCTHLHSICAHSIHINCVTMYTALYTHTPCVHIQITHTNTVYIPYTASLTESGVAMHRRLRTQDPNGPLQMQG